VSDGPFGPVIFVVVRVSGEVMPMGQHTVAVLEARAAGYLGERSAGVKDASPDLAAPEAIQSVGMVTANLEAWDDPIVRDLARAEIVPADEEVLAGHLRPRLAAAFRSS